LNGTFNNDDRSGLPQRVARAVKSAASADDGIGAAALEIGRELRASRLVIVAQRDGKVILAGSYSEPGTDPLRASAFFGLGPELTAFVSRLEGPLEVSDISRATGPAWLLAGLMFPGLDQSGRGLLYLAPIPVDRAASVLIILCRRAGRGLSWLEKSRVETAGAYLALALNQTAVFESAKRRSPYRLPSPANGTAGKAAGARSSLELGEILSVAVKELGDALGTRQVWIDQVIGDTLERVAGPPATAEPGASDARDTFDLIGWPTAGREAVRGANGLGEGVYAVSNAGGALAVAVGVHTQAAGIVCPVFAGEGLWGVLSVEDLDPSLELSRAQVLVQAVAARLEIALSHTMQMEKAEDAGRRERLIIRIIELINQSSLLNETFPALARELGQYLACDALLIASIKGGAGTWTIECQYRNGETVAPAGSFDLADFDVLMQRIEHGPLLCNDVESDQRLASLLNSHLRPALTRALMIVPITYEDNVRLAIVAVMNSGPRMWTNAEAEILRTAADQVLVALERAELFEMVSRSKHEWESTFDALSDGIFIFDSDGKLSRVNRAGTALEGAEATDLIGLSCCDLLKGIGASECRVRPVIQTGKPVTFELLHGRLARSLLVTVSRLNADGAANPYAPPAGAVCTVRDLSELRAAEAIAREQRGFLANLIEHANDAIAAVSPDGKLIWFNEQLTKLSGYTREELFGADTMMFPAEGEKKMVSDKFMMALAGAAQTFEMRGVRRSGENRLVLMTYTPIYDQGRVSSVLTIARDITQDRIAAERAAQSDKLRALGQLASGVAHNFNNALTAILGHAQLLRREHKDEGLLHRLDVIEQAAMDGAQTVKRIQGFAIQSSEQAFQPVDVNQIVQDSANLTRARWADDAQANGLNYSVELDLQTAPLTRGSASELREVFVNIIFNALDAMPQGGRLAIATAAVDSNIKISFQDNGVGMSRPTANRVFEPFFTTKGTNGMGLGLAVSYSIIERHGGTIEALSNPGRGTTFTVTLPISCFELMESSSAYDAPSRFADILVIDDDGPVRAALVGMLSAAGHRADSASCGAEGLLKMESRRFNLVLTDLSMPEMDGLAVAGEIRRRWPKTKIVLATGYALPAHLEADRERVDAVVTKPIKFDDLTNTISQILSD
jgi:PAS domain S-box-containing protein